MIEFTEENDRMKEIGKIFKACYGRYPSLGEADSFARKVIEYKQDKNLDHLLEALGFQVDQIPLMRSCITNSRANVIIYFNKMTMKSLADTFERLVYLSMVIHANECDQEYVLQVLSYLKSNKKNEALKYMMNHLQLHRRFTHIA